MLICHGIHVVQMMAAAIQCSRFSFELHCGLSSAVSKAECSCCGKGYDCDSYSWLLGHSLK